MFEPLNSIWTGRNVSIAARVGMCGGVVWLSDIDAECSGEREGRRNENKMFKRI